MKEHQAQRLRFVRGPRAMRTLCFLLSVASAAVRPSHGAGPMGVDSGWTVDNQGRPILTAEKAAAMVRGGTGYVRLEFRLVNGAKTWDPAVLAVYDTVVDTARRAGLQIIGLIDYTSWPGRQADWCANNFENAHGNGDNPYVAGFATSAVLPVVRHFRDRIQIFEIWNEPNAWTSSPSPGVYRGGSFLYPSNYSQMLAHSYEALETARLKQGVTILSGGVFGHSIGDVYSAQNAGARYLQDTYEAGIQKNGCFKAVKARWGTYPLDAVGEHLYIDQGGKTTAAKIQQYIDWVRQAYTGFEGADTKKPIMITEVGWTTHSVSDAVQADNLRTAFAVFARDHRYIAHVTWFNWQDGGGDLTYGVVRADGSPKMSYGAYQQAEQYAGGREDGSVNPHIQAYFQHRGQAALGNPCDRGETAWVHHETWRHEVLESQDFDGGSHGALTVIDSAAGTFEVNSLHAFWRQFQRMGVNRLGPPRDNEHPVHRGFRQDFASGHSLTWMPRTGTVLH